MCVVCKGIFEVFLVVLKQWYSDGGDSSSSGGSKVVEGVGGVGDLVQ